MRPLDIILAIIFAFAIFAPFLFMEQTARLDRDDDPPAASYEHRCPLTFQAC